MRQRLNRRVTYFWTVKCIMCVCVYRTMQTGARWLHWKRLSKISEPTYIAGERAYFPFLWNFQNVYWTFLHKREEKNISFSPFRWLSVTKQGEPSWTLTKKLNCFYDDVPVLMCAFQMREWKKLRHKTIFFFLSVCVMVMRSQFKICLQLKQTI